MNVIFLLMFQRYYCHIYWLAPVPIFFL